MTDNLITLPEKAGITVKDAWGKVLLDSTEATTIDFRDPTTGRLIAVMIRLMDNRMWGLVTEQDSDWQGVLGQLGYTDSKFIISK